MIIISGGQTGVDRGALLAAKELGVKYGGYAPYGWIAEDGLIPEELRSRDGIANGLIEAPKPKEDSYEQRYRERTRKNIIQAPATILVYRDSISTPGTKKTEMLLASLGRRRKYVRIKSRGVTPHPGAVAQWIKLGGFRSVNVAGPRESKAPGIQEQTRDYMHHVIYEYLALMEGE